MKPIRTSTNRKLIAELLENVPCGGWIYGSGRKGDPMSFCNEAKMCPDCDLKTRVAKALKERK